MQPALSKNRPFWRKKRNWLLLIIVFVFAALASCSGTRMIMKTAANTPKGLPASPTLQLGNLDQWENSQSDQYRAAFEDHVYGQYPENLQLSELGRRDLPGSHFNGKGRVEILSFQLLNPGTGETREFGAVAVHPINAQSPYPLILSQNFCPNHNVVPVDGVPVPPQIGFDCSGDGFMAGVFTYFFGRYITTPPIEDILDRGYGFAAIYPSEFVPDNAQSGQSVLDQFFSNFEPQDRPGALAAWAAQFNLVADYFKSQSSVSKTFLYGHSRYGKTALLAAAFNPQIDAAIAHQSGTGGASLSRHKPGETIADITQGYPHWFGGRYASYADRNDALPIDQHQLLALIAPRPVLLGNARRDVWSDPNGGFRAAQAASPAYKLYGETGLQQSKLSDFDPSANLAFWIRPGTHGVVKEDWPAFLAFLDAHFKD